jgi:hypothetical protein
MQANDHIHGSEKRKAEEMLQELLLEGLQSSEPEEMNHGEWDEIRRQALRQFEARKPTKPA